MSDIFLLTEPLPAPSASTTTPSIWGLIVLITYGSAWFPSLVYTVLSPVSTALTVRVPPPESASSVSVRETGASFSTTFSEEVRSVIITLAGAPPAHGLSRAADVGGQPAG